MRFPTDKARRIELLEWVIDQGEGSHSVKPFFDARGHVWTTALADCQWLRDQGFITGYNPGGVTQ